MLDGVDFDLLSRPSPRMPLTLQQGRHVRGCRCNEAVPAALSPHEREAMIQAAACKLEELFEVLQVDHRNDHNTRGTPRRVAKMLVEETMRGRYEAPPTITDFDNINAFDQMLVTGPIELRSTCAHHMMPIYGEAFIGVLASPDGKLIGLSKYDRIVNYFASRLQIQEELVQQIGDFIMEKTAPRGLVVRVSAVHMCKTHRGVRSSHDGRMVTNAYFGELKSNSSLREEFQRECLALAARR